MGLKEELEAVTKNLATVREADSLDSFEGLPVSHVTTARGFAKRRPLTSMNRTMGPVEWLLLVLLSVLWGGSFFFAKVALSELRPLTLVLGRFSLAAMTLTIIVYLKGHHMPGDYRQWGVFLIMGMLNNLIPFSLLFWGMAQISSGLALLSTALAYTIYFRILAAAGATNLLLVTLLIPVSALLLGITILREPIKIAHIVRMALIALGLAAIDGRPILFLRTLFTPRSKKKLLTADNYEI